jgi:hypothetical protein
VAAVAGAGRVVDVAGAAVAEDDAGAAVVVGEADTTGRVVVGAVAESFAPSPHAAAPMVASNTAAAAQTGGRAVTAGPCG